MPKGDNKKRYKKEFAEQLPDMFMEGESVAEVCTELGVSRRAFYDWVKKYPEFKEAYEQGKLYSEAWWTKLGRAGAAGQVPLNATPWIFNMKNRFGWRDQPADETDDDATPVNIVINTVDASVSRDG